MFPVSNLLGAAAINAVSVAVHPKADLLQNAQGFLREPALSVGAHVQQQIAPLADALHQLLDEHGGWLRGEAWKATELVNMVRSLQPEVIIDNRLEVSGERPARSPRSRAASRYSRTKSRPAGELVDLKSV